MDKKRIISLIYWITTILMVKILITSSPNNPLCNSHYLIPVQWKLKRRTFKRKVLKMEYLMSRNTITCQELFPSLNKLNTSQLILIKWKLIFSFLHKMWYLVNQTMEKIVEKILSKSIKNMNNLSVKFWYKKNNS